MEYNKTRENIIKDRVIPDRKIIIWMNRKNHIFKIHDEMTLEEFKIKCKNSFKLSNFEHIIHYFNKYGTKYIIKNEEDFKKSLEYKIPKYYLTEDQSLIKSYDLSNLNKIKDEEKPNIIKNVSNLGGTIYENEDNKIKKIEKIKHFASLAMNEINTKMDYFLNSADYMSDFMKKYNSKNKEKEPKKFINSQEIIKKPGLLSKENEDKNDLDFILSLLAETLREKNIDIGIYKNNNNEKDNKESLYEVSLQYLFCGLFDKKK